MRFTPNKQAGFTLIEMLVVVPMVMLIVTIIIGFMVTLTGDALRSRERTNLVYEVHTALDRIEQDARISTGFVASRLVDSPQGPGSAGATGTFSAASTPQNTLIMTQNATTKSPVDATRALVHKNAPNGCGPGEGKEYNPTLKVTVVYLVQDNTLWRRTIVPSTGDTCDWPWQLNSCPQGFQSMTICRTSDEELLTGVTELRASYFDTPSAADGEASSTPNQDSMTLTVKLGASSLIAGDTISYSSSVRATRLNTAE